MRYLFLYASGVILAFIAGLSGLFPDILWSLVVVGPLIILGCVDVLQNKHALRRNFPILAHARYLMELVRPEINQYFIESNKDGVPFDRERRSIVYQRAKRALDTLPFGTQSNVYAPAYEWINHSIAPKPPLKEPPRVTVGGPQCKQPYDAALLNVSAMSFGALSKNALLALNTGARMGNFYHNTGEGGISPYHIKPGGDLVWQIGTGYFGCRNKADGSFNPQLFAEKVALPQVRMIEIKLSQGAKPGHGGILPAAKLTDEIVQIRHVEPGKDVVSPPGHTTFHTPIGLLEFVQQLRELSGGKPVGFKLCVGKRREFLAVVKAMLETGILPDFITVDGGEGGTGAAPLEFSNFVGMPLRDGLSFVHNSLVGANLRDKVRVIAAGKVITGFDMAVMMALGADICNAARAMMFALGCIQSLRCNTNRCPTGVATQDPELTGGLHVADKSVRVFNFQHETVHSLLDVVGACGLDHPNQLRAWHIMRRISATEVKHYAQFYPQLKAGDLLKTPPPDSFAWAWADARPDSFLRAERP